MEKHPQHTGKSRPSAPSRDTDPDSKSHKDQSDVSLNPDQSVTRSDASSHRDHPVTPLRAGQPVGPAREGVPEKDRKKIRNAGAKKADENPEIREDKPNRADFHHGSTSQAGSNYGQGSHDLPDQENHQGSESNDGANYDHEKGWTNEALRKEDID